MKTRFHNLMFILLLPCLFSCNSKHDNTDTHRPVKVNIMEVEAGSFTQAFEYAGTIEEAFSSPMSFTTSGRVTAVYVKEGQRVKQGQLLAQIDNTRALSAYNAAKATLDQALDGYERAQKVYQQGSLPEVKWVEIQTQLNQAQSLADIAKQQLDDCKLYAPVSGTVADRRIEVGATVVAYQTVMNLIGLDGLYVKMSVPEGDINQIPLGSHANVQVSALGDSVSFDAVLTESNPSADPLSHSYLVRMRIMGNTHKLLPGMVCKTIVESAKTTSLQKGVSVPNRAVQLDNEGHRFVWVVDSDSTAAVRRVAIGDLTNTGVIITEGLHSGDKVIIDGMLKVSSGTKVTFE